MQRHRSFIASRVFRGSLTIAALALLLATFVLAVHADPPTAGLTQGRPLDISFVPPAQGICGAVAIRIGEPMSQPDMAEFANGLNRFLAEKLKTLVNFSLPIQVQEVEQASGPVFITFADDGSASKFSAGLTSVRMRRPFDWAKLIRTEFPCAGQLLARACRSWKSRSSFLRNIRQSCKMFIPNFRPFWRRLAPKRQLASGLRMTGPSRKYKNLTTTSRRRRLRTRPGWCQRRSGVRLKTVCWPWSCTTQNNRRKRSWTTLPRQMGAAQRTNRSSTWPCNAFIAW